MANIANSRSPIHRGWHYDQINGRLAVEYNGTEVFDFDANDLAIAVATTITTGSLTVGGQVIASASGNLASANGLAAFNGAVTNLTVVDGIVTAAS